MRLVLFLALSFAAVFMAVGIMGLSQAAPGRAATFLFIGGSAAPAIATPGVTDVAWGLDPANPALVRSATLRFADTLAPVGVSPVLNPLVCAQVLDDALIPNVLANGCTVLTSLKVAGAPVLVNFDASPSETAPAATITGVNVTVIQPVLPTVAAPDGIEVIGVGWGLDTGDTSRVDRVFVTVGPFSGDNGAFNVYLTLRDISGGVLAQTAFTGGSAIPLSAVGNTTIETIVGDGWDLNLAPNSPVAAELITRFELAFVPTEPWDVLLDALDGVGEGGALTTDGTVIYALRGKNQTDFWRFDPATGFWTPLADTPQKVKQGGALVYAGGLVYALRGGDKKDFWRFNPDAGPLGAWTLLADTPEKVKWGGALAWDGDDTIYALRGGDKNDFWKFDPGAGPLGTWTPLAPAPQKVKEGGALVYADGFVYAFRGGGKKDFWRFDVEAGEWVSPPDLLDLPGKVKKGGALTTDGSGNIYALRGDDKKEVWRYRISGDGWDRGPDLPDKVKEGGAIVFVGGDIHVMRGHDKKDFWKVSPLPPFGP